MNTQHQQARSTFYNLLPQARPLRHRSPLHTSSIFEFVMDQPNIINKLSQQLQQQSLQIICYNNKQHQIHQIGSQFSQLFTNFIYKVHQQLDCSNNSKFGGCNIEVDKHIVKPSIIQTCLQQYLLFQSRFESGNLAMVAPSIQSNQYNLLLSKDINSSQNSTTQWFYFSVRNHSKTGPYTFNIVNYIKPYSAFQAGGMKPCIYSQKSTKVWVRGGYDIKYRKNTIERQNGKHYYSLSFTYNFNEVNDEVFFAYCYPYTQKRLRIFLDEMQKKHGDIMHRKIVTKTLGNNILQMISVTSQNVLTKKAIFISARVHPGQTDLSNFFWGTCEDIPRNSDEADRLRNQFIIRIFPMLNPDGVINGSYRASLSGDDLNRQWNNPDKNKHPQIYYVKKMISETPYDKILYIDLHGHSRKKASFMYGCQDSINPHLSRQLPYILSKKGHHFNYFNCNFNTPKYRQGTSRVTIWKQFQIYHSYTMQVSFCGSNKNKIHFQVKDYKLIGKKLGETISLYFCRKISEGLQVQQILQGFYNNQDLLNAGYGQSQGSSSQSQNQQENLNKLTKIIMPQRSQNITTVYPQTTTTSKKKWFYAQKNPIKKKKQQQSNCFKHRSVISDRLKIQHLELQLQFHSTVSMNMKKAQRPINQMLENTIHHRHQQLFAPNISFKPVSNKMLERTTDYNSIFFPKVLKSQYTKYQRYRKEQYQVNISPIYYNNKFVNKKNSMDLRDLLNKDSKILTKTKQQSVDSINYKVRRRRQRNIHKD